MVIARQIVGYSREIQCHLLLFVICLKPLMSILNNTRKGYKLDNGNVLNHLLFMDDLKLYGKNEKETESLLYTV